MGSVRMDKSTNRLGMGHVDKDMITTEHLNGDWANPQSQGKSQTCHGVI